MVDTAANDLQEMREVFEGYRKQVRTGVFEKMPRNERVVAMEGIFRGVIQALDAMIVLEESVREVKQNEADLMELAEEQAATIRKQALLLTDSNPATAN